MSKKGYNNKEDLEFEESVAKKIEEYGYKIYGRNVIWDMRKSRLMEIDILMYKTIVECKNTTLRDVGEKKFTRQMSKYIEKFPDFKIVVWFKSLDKGDETYKEMKESYKEVIFVDNIYDFLREYERPKEFYYIREPEVLWSLIARSNPNNYDNILPYTKINPLIISCVECYLNDEIEEEKLRILKEMVIKTDKLEKGDIYLTCRKNYDYSDGLPIYNRYYMKMTRYFQTSDSLPKFIIEGCHFECNMCNKIYTIKRRIKNMCKNCY